MPRVLVLLAIAPGVAWAQGRVPDRQIPPSVLSELRQLEGRFDMALAADCDAERCFSKGCSYVDHDVADRPRSGSLPGLGMDPGPNGVEPQEFLTRARCAFAHEDSITPDDVAALSRRLASKVSKGWTVVTVDHDRLVPLPDYLLERPDPNLVEDTDPPAPPPPTRPEPSWLAVAARELWVTLLPHFAWMIAVLLGTIAVATLIWAWRRVGKESLEDRMMLAEFERGLAAEPEAPVVVAEGSIEDDTFVEDQRAAWTERLEAGPDPKVEALVRELLRSGDLPLLAKAVLTFPATFPAAFPAGGELAAAKIELAEYLKTVEPESLPEDAAFFRDLNRHALSASVLTQSDARVVRSLREEFGAAGLASLIGQLDPRTGALLFALAPADEQQEIVRLLHPAAQESLAEMLLRSNRMDPAETEHLFEVVSAARANRPLPEPPSVGEVTDRGAEFHAVGALSTLLDRMDPARRAAVFGVALRRTQGGLPAWTRGMLFADMLQALPEESRADLLLEVDVEPLAAWMSLLDPSTRDGLLDSLPGALRSTIRASSVFPSRARQLALAEQGRRQLASGFQLQLARAGIPFERTVVGGS